MQLSAFLNKLISAVSFSTEVWMSIFIGAVVTLGIGYLIYRIQKKESTLHKQDHDAKLEEIKLLHQQDSEKIKVLYELIIQSQKTNISEAETAVLEQQIEVAAEQITEQDSDKAQALKAIAEKDKEEADNLLDKIAQREHDLVEVYNLRAMNEFRAGNYLESTKWYKKVYELIPEDRGNLKSYVTVLMKAGELDKAEPFVDDAIPKLEQEEPIDIDILFFYYYEKAAICNHKKKPEATNWMLKGIELLIRNGRENSTEHLDALSTLATFYADIGNYTEAEKLLRKVLQAKPENAINKHNLVHLLMSIGQYPEAEQLALEVYDSFIKEYGEEHPNTIKTLNNLALLHSELKKFNLAEKEAIKVRDIFLKNLHPESNEINLANANLANIYCEQGKYPEAEPLMQFCLEHAIRNNGRDSFQAAFALNGVGMVYTMQNLFAEGLPYISEAYNTMLKYLPQHETNMRSLARNYGHALTELGKAEEALPIYHSYLDALKQNCQDAYNETAFVCLKIAQNYGALGDEIKEEEYLRQGWQELGENPEQYRSYPKLLNALIPCLQKAGKTEEAEIFKSKAEELKTKLEQESKQPQT